VTRLPKQAKPSEQLRRRNRPESWVVLPAAGCKRPVPKWPAGAAAKDEAELWKRLWVSPVAAWWHEQQTPPTVVARYVRLSLAKPEHATVGQLERELGLTPAAMLRMRLMVEPPEEEAAPGPDPYAHLREGQGG
jgi:hypothetical protein